MEHKCYSIRDDKSQVYNRPFFNATHGEAERTLHSLVNDEKSMISQYPSDFSLYYVGTYDDNTGRFEPCDPQHIAHASSLKKTVTQ